MKRNNESHNHSLFFRLTKILKGNNRQKQVVRESFNIWKDVGIGLVFIVVATPSEAEIRIGFQPGSSWSYVGSDAIDLVSGIKERTMTFGWNLTTDYGRDTALHETGHALGFLLEHQNPNAGIIWNEEAIYSYFSGPPNYWNRDNTYYNIIRKILPAAVEGLEWDKSSVIHYQFQLGLITTLEKYHNQPLIPVPGLSIADIKEVQKFYPVKTKKQITKLKPYLSKLVKISRGEQLDFIIQPEESRKYTIQTFGNIDTVIVLF